ncbi:MAG TPA: lysophospholipid acyltransferase family protein [Thermoanaerobaculia bacterium]|nr:lysophospholipid acyltransferase family protein [Thermoanaerobaculia bacterium]
MLRTLFLIAAATADTLIVAPLVTIIGLVNSHSPLIDRLIRWWALVIVRAAGLTLTAQGTEKLDPARRYILVANHASYLDIPILFAAVHQPLRFLAKASLFKVPIFGWGLKYSGFVPIDRKNRKTAIASFDLASSRIAKGNSIVVFPEEGRSSERQMKPFQRGAFLLALKSGLPVVPVAIIGNFDALPPGRFSLHPGPIEVRIGDQIDPADFTVRQKEALSTAARQRIAAMLRGTRQEQREEGES